MKLIMENWKRFLDEAEDEGFLDALDVILKRWEELQASYGEFLHQKFPLEGVPEYVSDAPDYYEKWSAHPAGRRATYSQTKQETGLENEIMGLFHEYSDQDFLTNDVIWIHNLNYRAHAQQPWSAGALDYKGLTRDNWETGLLEAQRTPQKHVLSCHGMDVQRFRLVSSWGFFVKPERVVYAGKSDLKTQTIRTAHRAVRDKYKETGLPKTPGPEALKVKNPSEGGRRFIEWRRWLRLAMKSLPDKGEQIRSTPMWQNISLSKRDVGSPENIELTNAIIDALIQHNSSFKDPAPQPFSEKQIRSMRDQTILNEKDFKDARGWIEEGLLSGWKVAGWWFAWDRTHLAMGSEPHPSLRKLIDGIEVPIYTIDQFEIMTSKATSGPLPGVQEISKKELKRLFT